MPPIVVQNGKLLPYMLDRYDAFSLKRLRRFLQRQGVFTFTPLRTHLFPAAVVDRSNRHSGYDHVWVRDNVHVSYALYVDGDVRAAVRCVLALMQFYSRHRHRFEDVLSARSKPADIMSRPHVRFDGTTLRESREIWAHAQNDALGYFLWIYCLLARRGVLKPIRADMEVLGLLARYFGAIRYWTDEDCGHWEEERKVEASSIGVVVAGLAQLRQLLSSGENWQGAVGLSDAELQALEGRGRSQLRKILPYECIQKSPAKKRRTDGALVFLVYPLDVVGAAMGKQILTDIRERLEGPYGIKRYVGDSYWAADYKEKLSPAQRTVDFSDSIEMRNKLLSPGEEAQWCLFDSIMSAAYGRRFQHMRKSADLERQTYYFNRALGQLTERAPGIPEFRCPEAYYLSRGRYVANDHTPLLWAHANLLGAMKLMETSLAV
jgi:phosphorylase kinase alpha/beta subunit